MFARSSHFASRLGTSAAFSALVLIGLAPTYGQTTQTEVPVVEGRIDFDAAGLPPATVELELNREILGDMYGLCDAAVAGVLQSLVEANEADSSKTTKIAAERLAAARELLQLTKEVVHEVRVRAYDGNLGEEMKSTDVAAKFEKQLSEEKWDRILKVRDGGENVQVSVKRVKGSLLGVFIVANEGNDLALVNVVCDASPENVKKLTAQATKIGLENGLREVLEKELRHLAD